MPDFKVLLVDDDPETSRKLTYLLNHRADDFAVFSVPTADQAEKLLRRERFDLGLVSNQLRGHTGLGFILAAAKAEVSTTFVLYSSDDLALDAARAAGVLTQANSYNGLIALADYALYRKNRKAIQAAVSASPPEPNHSRNGQRL